MPCRGVQLEPRDYHATFWILALLHERVTALYIRVKGPEPKGSSKGAIKSYQRFANSYIQKQHMYGLDLSALTDVPGYYGTLQIEAEYGWRLDDVKRVLQGVIHDVHIPLGDWGFHALTRSTPYNMPVSHLRAEDMPSAAIAGTCKILSGFEANPSWFKAKGKPNPEIVARTL